MTIYERLSLKLALGSLKLEAYATSRRHTPWVDAPCHEIEEAFERLDKDAENNP